MKTTILTLALTLVAGFAIAADDDAKGKGKGDAKGKGAPDPAKRAEMMLKKIDTDKDGKISKKEFAASPMAKRAAGDQAKIDKGFDRLDKDSNGSITKDELAKMGGGKGKGKPGEKGKGKPGEKGKGKGDS